ncbi:MAG: helix-turn-helix transcriptional regulator, partial [Atopobiaceae bacterium]|nr:helix-turn-helix transcriptional regulator [Atopobiaceae bacterium]
MFAIKKMRERKGMTQQEVADALGIKKPRYGDWERETREINLRDAIRLAELFGCSLDELAGRPWPTQGLSPEERALVDA